ncbi:hypothetical protein TTHERM_000939159 (macronuclear) [Tetrahymena thermophila SB210]|uniref:Uncharacterized protein n=1 Tax=Tetrahymena thermophila (strain SB210) TaxID=312017 RepID=W7X4J9_TETTS|nr:hypothetical protein TTHERM_000939159 [Tetrahymena thermophila SB210]7W5Z_K Chain K, Cytochrome c oxidase subunit TT11 [Tetrahymena thermophila]7W5Z_k Chain k, Cytochrome c oxidase subunit TT11 [Tetrahymena thermophila]8B6H_DZ Chain DZ, 39S ribosomal protein L9, mitochondrial [Tetrahymena thermophila SB210]8B6H_Dz Chain Dz, 39S ribosomal protein L9, mitochondrial [Tetrahymena thermophila SB210]8BQS_DZ Chain DZ, 39S ribosomal protein L9, mitochondrial [Tetrahymena thermophila SB210]8BQS_Dz |eukprot:XP_012655140.1 hypothetical protein TTHERM_000939159 [Tetrahymena thermophila SB210]
MFGRLVLKQTRRTLFNPVLKNTFCIYQAYQNPLRHINTGHNPNNVYEDIVMLGDYPVQNRTHDKVISQTYVPAIANIAFTHLSKKYPQAGLKVDQLNTLKEKTWNDLGVNIEHEKQEILVELSEQIFVKESKLRWVHEQRQRLAHTTYVFSGLEFQNVKVGFFIDSYNFLLQELAHRSNLYQSKDIVGEKSFHEKHLEQQTAPYSGVKSLEEPVSQNKSFINSLMRAIHNH